MCQHETCGSMAHKGTASSADRRVPAESSMTPHSSSQGSAAPCLCQEPSTWQSGSCCGTHAVWDDPIV